jgi:hypothetical protein
MSRAYFETTHLGNADGTIAILVEEGECLSEFLDGIFRQLHCPARHIFRIPLCFYGGGRKECARCYRQTAMSPGVKRCVDLVAETGLGL